MAVSNVSTIDSEVWQLITTTTITSGTASYNYTSISGYKTILIVGKNIVKAAANYNIVQFNGDTSAGAYAMNAQSGSGTQFYMTGNNAGPAAFASIIYDVDKALPHRVGVAYSTNASSENQYYTNPVAITSILVALDAGTYTSGTIYVYGIAS